MSTRMMEKKMYRSVDIYYLTYQIAMSSGGSPWFVNASQGTVQRVEDDGCLDEDPLRISVS